MMGFFDTLGKILNSTVSFVGDTARQSDDPNTVMRYLEHFDQQLARANLEALEKMLSDNAYMVNLDSSNDYNRQRRLQDRIIELRQERTKRVAEEQKEFGQWLARADIDDLESGLSSGRYRIQYDEQNDASRRERIEKKLRPLQEKREEEERRRQAEQREREYARMEQLFSDYLARTEEELYKSYYVFCDFRNELSQLTSFQKEILNKRYSEQVQELLSKPVEELNEIIANYSWQVNRKKTVAGKSLMLLILAERSATGEVKSMISKALADMEEAVLRNAYSGYIEEEDRELPADGLLQKGNAAKIAGQPQKAGAYYWAAANGNNVEAMYRLGLSFLYGLGMPMNNDKAFFWLSKAAKLKSPEGMYGLAVCYYWGYGVESDINRAIALYEESFSLGCAASGWPLGGYYEAAGEHQDLEASFDWYLKSAKSGCLEGMYCVYIGYCNGTGVEADEAAASEWLARLIEAAGQENSVLDITAYISFNNLGRAFYNGWTGTGGKDQARALEWFKKGVAAGYMTSKTWFIDFDEYESRNRILKELEAENYAWALNELAGYYSSGTGIEKDEVWANYYYLKAAKYGNSNAQYKIGMAYLNGGTGIRQDQSEAVAWLEKAAAQGVDSAKSEIEAYREKLAQQQKEREEQEARARWQQQEAEFQARRTGVMEKKAALDSQMADLMQQLTDVEKRIDSAANEKEEAAAIAEQETIQAKINELKVQVEALGTELSGFEEEAKQCGYTLS